MGGYNRTEGLIVDYNASEERYWSLFNYVFMSSPKSSSYKLCFIKSILDNLLNASVRDDGMYISYSDIFKTFTGEYWSLVLLYEIQQGQTELNIEKIIKGYVVEHPTQTIQRFDELKAEEVDCLTSAVMKSCEKYVIGAVYEDFEGILYRFDKKHEDGIVIAYSAYNFMLKYQKPIELLNYGAWTKYLINVNTRKPQ